MNEFLIEEIMFDEIKVIWEKDLWPNRQSEIEEFSYINHLGAIDKTIKQWAAPVFLGIRDQNRCVAVTSFYQTSSEHWRLRGTWIDPQMRQKGLGRKLLMEVVSLISKKQSKSQIWTMARETAVDFYIRNQFQKGQKITSYEFGPHYLMMREITT